MMEKKDPTGSAKTAAKQLLEHRAKMQLPYDMTPVTTVDKPRTPYTDPKPKPSSMAPREGKKKKSYGKPMSEPVINDKEAKKYR